MPRRRKEQLVTLRRMMWERAGGMCEYPHLPHAIDSNSDYHIDLIVPIDKGGKHLLSNLRVLCRYHFVLKAGQPQAIIEAALRDGLIPEGDWHHLVWEDEDRKGA